MLRKCQVVMTPSQTNSFIARFKDSPKSFIVGSNITPSDKTEFVDIILIGDGPKEIGKPVFNVMNDKITINSNLHVDQLLEKQIVATTDREMQGVFSLGRFSANQLRILINSAQRNALIKTVMVEYRVAASVPVRGGNMNVFELKLDADKSIIVKTLDGKYI